MSSVNENPRPRTDFPTGSRARWRGVRPARAPVDKSGRLTLIGIQAAVSNYATLRRYADTEISQLSQREIHIDARTVEPIGCSRHGRRGGSILVDPTAHHTVRGECTWPQPSRHLLP